MPDNRDNEKSARETLLKGASLVIVKDGPRGSWGYTADKPVVRCPAIPTKAIKNFGSGDAFAAGLMFGILRKKELLYAMRLGSACASIMVGGGRGSQIGYIHRCAATRDRLFDFAAGAFDINPARGEEFGVNIGIDKDRCYPDYKTMFAEEAKREDGIQAVSIATPNFTHYEILKAALEAGLHAVCEKPLCFTTEQARELLELSRKQNRIVGITYGYTGAQMIHQGRRMIKEGLLGEIRIINACFAHATKNFFD